MTNENRHRDEPRCLGCLQGTPTQGPRICPMCGHEFRGNGWDGIDAHWRARHEDVRSYEHFWDTLCVAHRGIATPPDESLQ
jgi:hypothetical protein